MWYNKSLKKYFVFCKITAKSQKLKIRSNSDGSTDRHSELKKPLRCFETGTTKNIMWSFPSWLYPWSGPVYCAGSSALGTSLWKVHILLLQGGPYITAICTASAYVNMKYVLKQMQDRFSVIYGTLSIIIRIIYQQILF